MPVLASVPALGIAGSSRRMKLLFVIGALSVLNACRAQTPEQVLAAEREMEEAQAQFTPRGKMSTKERRRKKVKLREEMREKLLAPEQRIDSGFKEIDPPDFMLWNSENLMPKDLGLDWRFMSDSALSTDERSARLVALVDKMAHIISQLTQKVLAMEKAIDGGMMDEVDTLESEMIQLKNIIDAAVSQYDAHTKLIEQQIKDMMQDTLQDHRSDVKNTLKPFQKVHHGWLTPFVVLVLLLVALAFGLVKYHTYLVKKHVL